MTDFKLDIAKPEDAKGIINVLHKTWLATYPNKELGITTEDIEESYKDSYTEENLSQLRNKIKNSPINEKRIVVKKGGEIVAVATAVKEEDKNELRTIYVLPEFQGMGIGKMLWLEMKNFCDPSKDIVVHVATYSQNTIEFYKKLGFVDTGKRFGDTSWRAKKMGVSIPEMEMVIKGTGKIAEGYFYDVYDIGNNRILKKKKSFGEIAESIKGNTNMGILTKWFKTYRYVKNAENVTKRIKNTFPSSALAFLGHPVFKDGVDYEQDKVTLLMDYFDTHSLEENKIVIDKYTKLIKEFLKYGIHDYVYKFKNSYGVNREGEVVFIDFNEVTFSKTKTLNLAKVKHWREEAQFRKFAEGELKAYIETKLNETLTPDSVSQLWGTKASAQKYEDNPFEDEIVAKEWINSIENEKGMIRERELLPLLKKWSEDVQPETIVDIGMGQGGCVDSVQLKNTTRYIGIEPSKILVDRAIEKFSGVNREFVEGNAYHLPVADNVAGAAFSVNVWFHLKDLDTASKELSRVLKPGGKFLICTANPGAYKEWASRFDKDAKVDEKVIDGMVYVPINPLSRNLFFKHTMEEMLDAFTRNNLIVDRTELNGIFDRSTIPLFINFFGHKKF